MGPLADRILVGIRTGMMPSGQKRMGYARIKPIHEAASAPRRFQTEGK